MLRTSRQLFRTSLASSSSFPAVSPSSMRSLPDVTLLRMPKHMLRRTLLGQVPFSKERNALARLAGPATRAERRLEAQFGCGRRYPRLAAIGVPRWILWRKACRSAAVSGWFTERHHSRGRGTGQADSHARCCLEPCRRIHRLDQRQSSAVLTRFARRAFRST